MDNDPSERRSRATFGPDRRLTALCAGGALIALILAITFSDAPGRLLFGIAAALLLGYVITDLAFAPRLAADPAGLEVRTPFVRAKLSWSDIEQVHADARQRYGLRTVTLEIDAGEQLIVLSRRALGQDPQLVAEIVGAFAPG